jgi:hypothetical protein
LKELARGDEQQATALMKMAIDEIARHEVVLGTPWRFGDPLPAKKRAGWGLVPGRRL